LKLCDEEENKDENEKAKIFLNITIAPIIDAFRVSIRTIITRSTVKLFSFPKFEDIIMRYMKDSLSQKVQFVDKINADIEVFKNIDS
jgi:hypothetical protein